MCGFRLSELERGANFGRDRVGLHALWIVRMRTDPDAHLIALDRHLAGVVHGVTDLEGLGMPFGDARFDFQFVAKAARQVVVGDSAWVILTRLVSHAMWMKPWARP